MSEWACASPSQTEQIGRSLCPSLRSITITTAVDWSCKLRYWWLLRIGSQEVFFIRSTTFGFLFLAFIILGKSRFVYTILAILLPLVRAIGNNCWLKGWTKTSAWNMSVIIYVFSNPYGMYWERYERSISWNLFIVRAGSSDRRKISSNFCTLVFESCETKFGRLFTTIPTHVEVEIFIFTSWGAFYVLGGFFANFDPDWRLKIKQNEKKTPVRLLVLYVMKSNPAKIRFTTRKNRV